MKKSELRNFKYFLKSSFLISLACILCGCNEAEERPRGVISIGGDITEIIYALGKVDQLIGRDTTSFYPPSVTSLPDIGYVRQLGAEGLLSLSPDLIIASSESGPPEVVEQIRGTGIPFVMTEDGFDMPSLLARIQTIGKTLGAESKAKELSDSILEKMDAVNEKLSEVSKQPKVLFLMSATDGSPMAAGTETAADSIINLAKGKNIFSDQNGYRAYSFEALAAAEPDVIMMMEHSLASLGGIDAIQKHPALGMTPAALTKNIIAIDGLFLLGFGPRLPEAIAYVADRFHPGLGVADSIAQ